MSITEKQIQFFEEIKRLTPAHINPVTEIADVAEISPYAAKRLARGTTSLKICEMTRLAVHYGISLDRLYGLNKGAVEFQYSNLNLADLDQYDRYLQRLLAPLKSAAESADSRAIFVADDIPVFHAMQFPMLIYFKLYAWCCDVNQTDPKICFEAFVDELRTHHFESVFATIVSAYEAVPVTEIWTEQTLSPFLRLLDYYRRLKTFRDEDTAFQLLAELSALLKKVQRYAELGKRGIGKRSKLDILLSPVDPGHGLLYVTHGDHVKVMLQQHSMNSMWTTDPDYCSEVENVLAGTIRKCSKLSSTSEIGRNEFFEALQASINLQTERWGTPHK